MTKNVIINGANESTLRVSAIQQYILENLGDVTTIKVFKPPEHDLITTNFKSEAIKVANNAVE